MKSHALTVAMLFLGGLAQAGGYIEGTGGLFKESYGYRGGNTWERWDGSIGYLKDTDHDSDFHTLGAEAYWLVPSGPVRFRLGGGVGYTMPNVVGKKADNGPSFTAGAGAEYMLSSHWALVGTAKGFFFKTDTHWAVYSSHPETLSTGQEVGVLDVENFNASESFNSFQALLSVRYYF